MNTEIDEVKVSTYLTLEGTKKLDMVTILQFLIGAHTWINFCSVCAAGQSM